MKKLMFLAVVASAAAAFANTCVTTTVKTKDPCTGEVTKDKVTGVGTAHKVAITLKTTAPKYKKAKNDCSACTYYVDQTTVKINGLIWKQLQAPGCDECTPYCQGLMDQNALFWTKDALLDVDFAVKHGVIGKKGSKKIEAFGAFGDLKWAGFGTLAIKEGKSNPCGDPGECSAYVKSISGGIAGQLVAPEYDNECVDCDPIEYAGCCEELVLANTAAYGTIKISYDAATAKKVAIAEDVDDVASFVKLPAAVAADITVNEVAIEE